MNDDSFKSELRRRSLDAGFADVRIAPAQLPSQHELRLRAWLESGMHGEMNYMAREAGRRAGADAVLPGARSVLVFAANYVGTADNYPNTQDGGETCRVAKYAVGKDYHFVLRDALQPIANWLDVQKPGYQWRICVDSAPILERAYAVEAGIGFWGKNTMVLAPRTGSFFFLAEIVTTAEIAPDSPVDGTCGECTRCIDACPTAAITAPFLLDARKCISYLTIEKKSELTPLERDALGPWAFGCDICQDVCPYNKFAGPAGFEQFADGTVVHSTTPLETFMSPRSNRQFERHFADSPLLRPGRRRLQRNSRIAADNQLTEKSTATSGQPD